MFSFAWLSPWQNPEEAPPRRFWLWIDGVGGYLVCLDSRITLGQALPNATVDIPLLADISRLHASLTRDTEGYLLEALHIVRINGHLINRALLRTGDRVTLGRSCQFQFRRPTAVSASAHIQVTSGHRLPLAATDILLMADTLLMGAGPQMHICLPDARQTVVLFRSKDGLSVRCAGGISVDGKKHQERAMLGPASKVSGDDFAFALEPIETKMGQA